MSFRNKNQRQIWKSLEIERGINARISPIKIGDIYKDLRCQTKPIAPKKIKKIDFTGPKEGFLLQFEGEWAQLLFEL